jgi:hypothetical protein
MTEVSTVAFVRVVSPMTFMQLVCQECKVYTKRPDLRCVPEELPPNSTVAKCYTCRQRSIVCEWGTTIPRQMNEIKMKIHFKQIGTNNPNINGRATDDAAKRNKTKTSTKTSKRKKTGGPTQQPTRTPAKSSTREESSDVALQMSRAVLRRIVLERVEDFEQLADKVLDIRDT